MVFADLNSDGFLDFAASALTTNQIAVYLNNGTGGYNGPTRWRLRTIFITPAISEPEFENWS